MMHRLALLCMLSRVASLVVPLPAARPAASLDVSLPRVGGGGETVHLGNSLVETTGKTMLCFGTHAADFNSIEYLQKLRFYAPRLRAAGVDRLQCVLNADAAQISTLADLLDVPDEIELFADPTGEAGRKFGVSRGFRPDDDSLSPFVKLFVVGLGFGPPWGTLVPVLKGYAAFGADDGSPISRRRRGESVGQPSGRGDAAASPWGNRRVAATPRRVRGTTVGSRRRRGESVGH